MPNPVDNKQQDFFSKEADALPVTPNRAGNHEVQAKQLADIDATYIPDFLENIDVNGDDLLKQIDKKPWLDDLSRRVQHYGYKYDYKQKYITAAMKVGIIPDFIAAIGHHLHARDWFDRPPDQVIINEYQPGQGIAAHSDRSCFGPTVATLSLGDCWPMVLCKKSNGKIVDKMAIPLAVGSLLLLQGRARYEWTHEIRKRTTRPHSAIPYQRRVSITFRTVTDIR